MPQTNISYGNKRNVSFNNPETPDGTFEEGLVFRVLGESPSQERISRIREVADPHVQGVWHYLTDLGAVEALRELGDDYLNGKSVRADASVVDGFSFCDLRGKYEKLPTGFEEIVLGRKFSLELDNGFRGDRHARESLQVHCVVDPFSTDQEIYEYLNLEHPEGGEHETPNLLLRSNIIIVGGDPPGEVDRINLFMVCLEAGVPLDEMQYIKTLDQLSTTIFSDYETHPYDFLQDTVTNMVIANYQNNLIPDPKNSVAAA